MRYLLVDHITGIDPDKSIRGIKNVAMTEDFLEFHFPRNPIMPGVMLLESLAQMTGWLSAVSSDFDRWFVIGNVLQCKYYGFAYPGDQVELEVTVSGEDDQGSPIYLGMAKVGGRKKVVAEFSGQTLPLSDLDEVEDKRREYQVLTRSLPRR
ncbi:MAG: beta-hydroxyacyl-ACP dehydratase [Gammaproteobacteria bacterium]|nr:beta-hydroxyacyl-ACP dehydratase [Gammaproteobacteria bacterium]